jgi:hypothetical protein
MCCAMQSEVPPPELRTAERPLAFCEGVEKAEQPVCKGRWKIYTTAAALAPLLRWLNKNGVNESALRARLKAVQVVMEAGERKRVRQAVCDSHKGSAGNSEVRGAALHDSALLSMDGVSETGCSAEMTDIERAAPSHEKEEGSADAMDGTQVGGDSYSGRLGRMLLELEAALPPAGVLMVRGGELRRASWRAFVSRKCGVPLADSDDDFVGGYTDPVLQARGAVEAAATPQDAMCALLVLESMIATPWLRPYWRLWSLPLPTPSATRTWAEVYYRLRALRKALRDGRAAPTRRELDQFEKAAVPIERVKRQRQPPREALRLDLDAVSGYEGRASRRTRARRISYRDVGDEGEEEDDEEEERGRGNKRGWGRQGLPETELPGAEGRAARAAQRAARGEGQGRAARASRRARTRRGGATRSDSEGDGRTDEEASSSDNTDEGYAKRLHAQLNTRSTRRRL